MSHGMIDLGNGHYLDLPLALFTIVVTALVILPPWLAWKWATR